MDLALKLMNTIMIQ